MSAEPAIAEGRQAPKRRTVAARAEASQIR